MKFVACGVKDSCSRKERTGDENVNKTEQKVEMRRSRGWEWARGKWEVLRSIITFKHNNLNKISGRSIILYSFTSNLKILDFSLKISLMKSFLFSYLLHIKQTEIHLTLYIYKYTIHLQNTRWYKSTVENSPTNTLLFTFLAFKKYHYKFVTCFQSYIFNRNHWEPGLALSNLHCLICIPSLGALLFDKLFHKLQCVHIS